MFRCTKRITVALIFAGFLASALTAFAASCDVPQRLEAKLQAAPSADIYTELGNWFDRQGELSCAQDSYTAALKVDPKSRPALDGLARSQIAGGDPAAAIKLLRNAPHDEQLTLDLASAYSKAGMTNEASETLVRALRTTPGSARLTSALVVTLAGNGHLEEAYQLAEHFAKLHPTQPEAQKVYLRVLVATNDSATARPLARKMLAASPHDGELLYLSGILERKAGEFTAARDHLRQAVAQTPNYADSRYNLGLVLAKLQDFVGAKEQLEKAIALGSPEPEAHLELSKVLRNLGETEPAQQQLTLYQQAMKAHTDRAMATTKSEQAAQALAKGDATKAVSLYREAVEATPQDASLQFKLAQALDRVGDLVSEQTVLEQAVQIAPNSAPAQTQLSYLLFHNGDYDAAEEHIRLALKAAPDLTQAWVNLAAILATKSKFPEAQDAVAHALRLDPHNAEALQMKKELIASKSTH